MKKQMIQKATLWERFNHGVLALSFIILFITGLGFLYQSLNWLNTIFGGNHLAKDIHNWAGVVFGISLLLTIGNYLSESLSFSAEDEGWFSSFGGYFSKDVEPPPQGRLNAGQKLFYLTVLVFGIAISISGFIIWLFPWSRGLILFGHFLHNLSVLVFSVTIPVHAYLGTAANPGTFRVMTRGTVTPAWAKKHHAKWAKELNID